MRKLVLSRSILVAALVVAAGLVSCGGGDDRSESVVGRAEESSPWKEYLFKTSSDAPGTELAASNGKLLIGQIETLSGEGEIINSDWFRVDIATGQSDEIQVPDPRLSIQRMHGVVDGFLLVAERCPDGPISDSSECFDSEFFFLGTEADNWVPVKTPVELGSTDSDVVFRNMTLGLQDGSNVLVGSTMRPVGSGSPPGDERFVLRWRNQELTVENTLSQKVGWPNCIGGDNLYSFEEDTSGVTVQSLTDIAKRSIIKFADSVDTSHSGAGLSLGCTSDGAFLISRQPRLGGEVRVFPLVKTGESILLDSITTDNYIEEVVSGADKIAIRTRGLHGKSVDTAVAFTSDLKETKLLATVARSMLVVDGASGDIYAVGPLSSAISRESGGSKYSVQDIQIIKI